MTTKDTPTPVQPIKVYRNARQPIRVKVRADRHVPGVWINAGPLQGTLPPGDAIRLATEIIDTLQAQKESPSV